MNLADIINSNEIIILDGGMGTQLETRGSVMGGRANLENPDTVLEIQKLYLKSGSQGITANTFSMNRVYIESHNLDIDVKKVNVTGVEIAKKAAGPDHFVLGDIGSMGKLIKPYGPVSESEAMDTFTEQVEILNEAEVDGFIIETMIDLREALAALKACTRISNLPVIVSMSFTTSQNGGKTIMGNSAEECAKALTEAGAASVGANCGGVDPFQMAEIISVIRESTALPVIAMPNAGMPKVVNRRPVFNMTPSEYLIGVRECVNAGAKILGGCCGTTPDHIAAVVKEFGG